MKFHALLPVRDEADIIDQSLRHLLTWADAIYVFDSGSEDETWAIVQQFAMTDKRVIPLKKESVFFSDKTVRAWLFHQARQQMRDGDWFARVDADEFHHLTPPEFVGTRMRKHETLACHQYYDFRLRTSDVSAWEDGKDQMRDRAQPIEVRRRWFTVSSYTEPRLCRYRSSMQWPETVSFPYNAGYRAVERLPIRHYPHRDPAQMERRCRLRAAMALQLENAFGHHWTQADWRAHIIDDSSLELRYWEPGTDLPQIRFKNHVAPFPKRIVQRLAHGLFLPIFDRFRIGYREEAYPRRISRELARRLA